MYVSISEVNSSYWKGRSGWHEVVSSIVLKLFYSLFWVLQILYAILCVLL
jgi:hypothetical protein